MKGNKTKEASFILYQYFSIAKLPSANWKALGFTQYNRYIFPIPLMSTFHCIWQ